MIAAARMASADSQGLFQPIQSKVLDDAIANIGNAQGNNQLTQSVTLALVEIDASLERLQSARSQAGDDVALRATGGLLTRGAVATTGRTSASGLADRLVDAARRRAPRGAATRPRS